MPTQIKADVVAELYELLLNSSEGPAMALQLFNQLGVRVIEDCVFNLNDPWKDELGNYADAMRTVCIDVGKAQLMYVNDYMKYLAENNRLQEHEKTFQIRTGIYDA